MPATSGSEFLFGCGSILLAGGPAALFDNLWKSRFRGKIPATSGSEFLFGCGSIPLAGGPAALFENLVKLVFAARLRDQRERFVRMR